MNKPFCSMSRNVFGCWRCMSVLSSRPRLLVVASLLSLAFFSSDACAAVENFAGIAGLWESQIGSLTTLIVSICYVVGISFMGTGLVKLKEHAESPHNVKMAVGIGRMLAGGAAISLPLLSGWLHSTLGFGSTTGTISTINVF